MGSSCSEEPKLPDGFSRKVFVDLINSHDLKVESGNFRTLGLRDSISSHAERAVLRGQGEELGYIEVL